MQRRSGDANEAFSPSEAATPMKLPPSVDPRRLPHLVARLRGRRVLVIADLVADEFIHGRLERISREAPVLILRHDGMDTRLGGGANAVHNIRTLGGVPIPIGVLGRDVEGDRLLAMLRGAAVGTRRVFRSAAYSTPVKSRVLAGGTHAVEQQVVRIDRTSRLAPRDPARARAASAVAAFRGRVDGVLVSDYGLGFVTPQLVGRAVRLARRAGVPITVDSRHTLTAFRGMTAITPNEGEVEAALGIRIGNDTRKLESAGRTLLRRVGSQVALVTRGSDGMALFERGQPPVHIGVSGSDEVADVTGAGDTVIATFTLALAAGATAAEAAVLANVAAGVVVMKRGTATVSAAELSDAVSRGA